MTGGLSKWPTLTPPPASVPRLKHSSWYISDHICLRYLLFLPLILRLRWLWRNRELVWDIGRGKFAKQLLSVPPFPPNEVNCYLHKGRSTCCGTSWGEISPKHAVWNDSFVDSYSRRSLTCMDYLMHLKRLDLKGWVVSCRFQFASYCCRWFESFSFPGCSLIRIVSSTTPCSESLVHGFTNDQSVPYLFSTPQARSQEETKILIHLLKKLATENDISGVLYLGDPMWIFSPRIWKELQF